MFSVGLFLFGQTACNVVPYDAWRASHLRSLQLQRDQLAIQQQNQMLSQQLAGAQSQLSTANQRIANLKGERSQMQQQIVRLIERAKKSGNPLGIGATRQLSDLAKKYKNFEFDPETGVSKFHSDVLFDSGSDRLRSSALQVLREFAAILNEPGARKLKILVVGHTDDRHIKQGPTSRRHPTNWHLSTNRADSVVLELKKYGIRENRLGAAGYSMFQPITPNRNDRSRQMNRRVEIYVLAPDANVAGNWDIERKLR